ncbi:MAG: hypothetical protein O2913_13005 [Chloroflexi bacterium]|nr:hypothetical protein [Chloroflexota bacterium]
MVPQGTLGRLEGVYRTLDPVMLLGQLQALKALRIKYVAQGNEGAPGVPRIPGKVISLIGRRKSCKRGAHP